MRRSPLRPLEPCSGSFLRRNRAKAVFSTLATQWKQVGWFFGADIVFPIDHPTYLHLSAFLILHTSVFLRSILCSVWHKSGRACVHCDHFEVLEEGCIRAWSLCLAAGGSLSSSAPFSVTPLASAFALNVDWAVCSPNHYPAACSKFLLLAGLIQCPQGMSHSLWGWN